jgi:hypothetical protein
MRAYLGDGVDSAGIDGPCNDVPQPQLPHVLTILIL